MKNILFIVALLMSSFSYAQLPPPPQVEISADKKILIDELIKVTNFENHVYNYCKNIVLEYSKQNGWDEKKTQQILDNSNFKYSNQIFYYTFKDDSNETIKSLIKSFEKINKKRNPDEFLIPNNYQMQKDLVLFTIKVIQGQLLLNK